MVLGAALFSATVLWLGLSALAPYRVDSVPIVIPAVTATVAPAVIPRQELMAVVGASYGLEEALKPYARYWAAIEAGDAEALEALAKERRGGFLEYRIMLTLAQDSRLSPARRAAYYRRVGALMVRDPLAAEDERRVWLEHAGVAEAAGLREEAVGAYNKALPEPGALAGLRRLEVASPDLAAMLLEARQYGDALEALAGHPAPALEAPALRALGRHDEALSAYRRWLRVEPESEAARYGEAVCLFELGRNSEADARFAALPGESALSYRGHIARRADDVDGAIGYFRRAKDARNLWLMTGLLEARGRGGEAVALYLELAQADSIYADDAAYRAYVLAQRRGEAGAIASARALIPKGSYFALGLGEVPSVPAATALPPSHHPALALAGALVRAGDAEAAAGELRFALRDAEDEASAIDLAEALDRLGDYLPSYRAANAWVQKGSRDVRTWRLAYPRAYRDVVEAQAATWEVDPYFVWAVMRQESIYYPRAVSRSKAQGLMQVVPATWNWLAELKREAPGDSFDPHDNIRYGTYYLRYLLNMFEGDLELTAAAYNGGPGRISRLYAAAPVNSNRDDFLRFIDSDETREYVQRVLLNYHIYKVLYGDS